MSKLISKEEIEEIENEYPRKFGIGITVAKAQHDASDKEWIEELEAILIDNQSIGKKLIQVTDYIAELKQKVERDGDKPCVRCGKPKEREDSNICGSCADDLRNA